MTSREETGQVQHLAHGDNGLWQRRLGRQSLALLFGLLVIAHQGQTLLEGGRDGDERVAGRVRLDPLGNLGEVLVLLTDVVPLAQVDHVHDWLGREKEERIDNLDLFQSDQVSMIFNTRHESTKAKSKQRISVWDMISRRPQREILTKPFEELGLYRAELLFII